MASSQYPFLVPVESPEERGKRAARQLADRPAHAFLLLPSAALLAAGIGAAVVAAF